jgi:hypothetical protein
VTGVQTCALPISYYTIPIQDYTYNTTYGYASLLSLDNSGYITNNPTITNLQTIDTSLQTQINNIISSSSSDIKTITIGTTTTLDSGDNAYVVNVGNSQNMVLNFGIPRGYRGFSGSDGSNGSKGDKGDTGEKGDRGSDGSSVGIETVIGIIESIFTQLEIAGLQTQITALQGQITLIILRLETLEAKTIFQSIIGNTTRFTSNLGINNGVSDRISLYQDGSITSYGKLTVNDDITCNNLKCSDINTATTNNTNIHGSTINIGVNSSLFNTINLGGGPLSTINLDGIINSYGSFGFTNNNGYLNQFG